MSKPQTNNKNYSIAEILGYLSGKMTRQDSHALERAALDNEMLADAIEGYRLMRERNSDDEILFKLNTIVPGKTQGEPVTTKRIDLSWYRWISYAAAACFILAAGWWIFNLTRPENILPPELNPKDAFNPAVVQLDSGEKQSADIQVMEVPSSESITATKQSPLPATEFSAKVSVAESASPKPMANREEQEEIPMTKNEIALQEERPIALQTDAATEKKMITMQAKDSPVLEARRMMTASMQPIQGSSVQFRVLDTINAVPAEGWPAYYNYLSRSIQNSFLNKQTTLTLHIDPEGKVEQVDIAGEYAETEKMLLSQIISKGPAWKNKTGKPTKAVLQW